MAEREVSSRRRHEPSDLVEGEVRMLGLDFGGVRSYGLRSVCCAGRKAGAWKVFAKMPLPVSTSWKGWDTGGALISPLHQHGESLVRLFSMLHSALRNLQVTPNWIGSQLVSLCQCRWNDSFLISKKKCRWNVSAALVLV
jgi:hypothetical protein